MTDSGPIPQFLDQRPIIWNYTMLSTYEGTCPHQAAEKYIYKNIPYSPTPQQEWGNAVHKAMDLRVSGGKPLPETMHAFEPYAAAFDGKSVKGELKLGVTRDGRSCEFFDKSGKVWGRGTIDVPIVQGDKAFINDWKTGKQNLRYESPFELECHAVLLQAAYPNIRQIVGTYTYLGENKMSTPYDLSHTQKTWNRITAIVSAIEADKATGQWEKRQGPLCSWCEVESCEFNKRQERLAREKAA